MGCLSGRSLYLSRYVSQWQSGGRSIVGPVLGRFLSSPIGIGPCLLRPSSSLDAGPVSGVAYRSYIVWSVSLAILPWELAAEVSGSCSRSGHVLVLRHLGRYVGISVISLIYRAPGWEGGGGLCGGCIYKVGCWDIFAVGRFNSPAQQWRPAVMAGAAACWGVYCPLLSVPVCVVIRWGAVVVRVWDSQRRWPR